MKGKFVTIRDTVRPGRRSGDAEALSYKSEAAGHIVRSLSPGGTFAGTFVLLPFDKSSYSSADALSRALSELDDRLRNVVGDVSGMSDNLKNRVRPVPVVVEDSSLRPLEMSVYRPAMDLISTTGQGRYFSVIAELLSSLLSGVRDLLTREKNPAGLSRAIDVLRVINYAILDDIRGNVTLYGVLTTLFSESGLQPSLGPTRESASGNLFQVTQITLNDVVERVTRGSGSVDGRPPELTNLVLHYHSRMVIRKGVGNAVAGGMAHIGPLLSYTVARELWLVRRRFVSRDALQFAFRYAGEGAYNLGDVGRFWTMSSIPPFPALSVGEGLAREFIDWPFEFSRGCQTLSLSDRIFSTTKLLFDVLDKGSIADVYRREMQLLSAYLFGSDHFTNRLTPSQDSFSDSWFEHLDPDVEKMGGMARALLKSRDNREVASVNTHNGPGVFFRGEPRSIKGSTQTGQPYTFRGSGVLWNPFRLLIFTLGSGAMVGTPLLDSTFRSAGFGSLGTRLDAGLKIPSRRRY